MNLPESVSINNVEVTTSQDQPTDKLYDVISNDSKDNFVEPTRIIYSRDQLMDIYRSNNSDDYPDWIKNILKNPDFPKRLETQSTEDYINKLFEHDCSKHRYTPRRMNKSENDKNIKNKKESGYNDEEERGNEQQLESSNSRSNRQFVHPQENSAKPEFNKNSYNYGSYNNPASNNNFNKNGNMNSKFNEKSQIFNNRNDRIEDRNDGRSFLRSRGENLNQNFASFRRFPNRNQNASNNNNYKPYYQNDVEPEWFTDTITQHDTIELKGFDDEEDKSNLNKNSNTEKKQSQTQAKNHSNTSPVASVVKNEKQKDDFDLSELTNFDWQSVNAKTQQDIKSIDYQANSSRFARWFNEPTLVNSENENQIEKLFSNARSSNNNGVPNSPPVNYHTQQQINLQNDFFGNLMNRSSNQHQNAHSQQHPHQQPIKQQQIKQQKPQPNDYQHIEATEVRTNTMPNKKTNQQLLDILKKARINVDSLMVQQNENNLIKGEVKSAEELEASLLNNANENSRVNEKANEQPNDIQQSHSQHLNPVDFFQKLSLRKNEALAQNQSSKSDHSAINPFVLNLLDNAQNKPQKNVKFGNTTAINNKKVNYLHNMMFTNNQEKLNQFMPTSVIRKIANEKNNLASVKSTNELNSETVTGSLINELSLCRENINVNNAMNQNHMMQRNFALETGMRWIENNIQSHRVDSTIPDENEDIKSMNAEALKNILLKASKRSVDPHAIINNFSHKQQPINNNQFPKIQNDNQKKLIEILQKASTNYGKPEGGNKINNWFELELKRNNDHLSPIIKENAFTLEDIEKS